VRAEAGDSLWSIAARVRGDIPITRYVNPPLTTAAVPIAEMGRQALECCADVIAGRQVELQHIFKPVLVIRASSAGRS